MTDTATTDGPGSSSPGISPGDEEQLGNYAIRDLIEQLMHAGHEIDTTGGDPLDALTAWGIAYSLDAAQEARQQLASLVATQAKLEALYEQLSPMLGQLAKGGPMAVLGLLRGGPTG